MAKIYCAMEPVHVMNEADKATRRYHSSCGTYEGSYEQMKKLRDSFTKEGYVVEIVCPLLHTVKNARAIMHVKRYNTCRTY